MTPKITLVLAAPESLVIAGCRAFLWGRDDIEVVAECTSYGGTLRSLKRHRPRVLIIDASLCGSDVVDACHRIRRASPTTSIAWLGRANGGPPVEVLSEGISAALPPSVTPEQLVACVTTLAAGRRWQSAVNGEPVTDEAEARSQAPRGRSPLGLLTLRERQIVQGVASGQRNREIAAALGITPGTVKLHLHRIYGKLGVNSRLALFRKLVREAQPRS